MSQLTQRFQNIYNLKNAVFEIIGCGAIGSYTAMALVRAGAKYFMLYDDDSVATVNIGVQHFNLEHIGKVKTRMLADQMEAINPRCSIVRVSRKYGMNMGWHHGFYTLPREMDTHITIIGVDSMQARLDVQEKYFDKLYSKWRNGIHLDRWASRPLKNTWLIDARMGSETFQSNSFKLELPTELMATEDYQRWITEDLNMEQDQIMQKRWSESIQENINEMKQAYMNTWYSDEDGDSEPCNARSTGYCASMAAAFINNQVRKIVDNKSLPNREITFNFPSMTLLSSVDKSRLTL